MCDVIECAWEASFFAVNVTPTAKKSDTSSFLSNVWQHTELALRRHSRESNQRLSHFFRNRHKLRNATKKRLAEACESRATANGRSKFKSNANGEFDSPCSRQQGFKVAFRKDSRVTDRSSHTCRECLIIFFLISLYTPWKPLYCRSFYELRQSCFLSRGRPREDHVRLLKSLFTVLKTGMPWRYVNQLQCD